MYSEAFTWGKSTQLVMRRLWHLVPKPLRLYCYRILSALGRYLYGSEGGAVRQLPFGLYSKSCRCPGRNEAVALQLVEKYTSVPAPIWIDDYEENGHTTLIMTQVRGAPLNQVIDRLSYQELEQLSASLKTAIHQIRRIPNQTSFRFANTLGGPLYDHRLETSTSTIPYLSHPYRSFFSHADLNSRNILISRGRLAGIVDWECAGFFPEYWEYTKAIYGIISNRESLESIIRHAFDEDYEEELKVERVLWNASTFML
ncbi:kinase-like domain-containing protein [Aspergillus avenaceus]|uniref:Kinase-like domain-containing protein n=1 Tax=Aspergillus avenaceus TaxID=36643 RepID=A0A5N6TEJ0_ASPAV|nr:kinase-like domain-containing protein [Aspergillus avenaceus]